MRENTASTSFLLDDTIMWDSRGWNMPILSALASNLSRTCCPSKLSGTADAKRNLQEPQYFVVKFAGNSYKSWFQSTCIYNLKDCSNVILVQ